MSDTRVLIELRVTHEQPIPDADTLAQLAARSITEALADDPVALASAVGTPETREAVFVEGWMAAERNALENIRWRGTLHQRITRAMRKVGT